MIIDPRTTVIVPMITGRLNISIFRLNRKEKISRKTGEVEVRGETTLAGDRFRAK